MRETKEIRKDIGLNVGDALSGGVAQMKLERLKVVASFLVAEMLLDIRDELVDMNENSGCY